MKRALLMGIFMVSLTFGTGSACAFPNGPCMPAASQRAESGISRVQLLLLLLPALARTIV